MQDHYNNGDLIHNGDNCLIIIMMVKLVSSCCLRTTYSGNQFRALLCILRQNSFEESSKEGREVLEWGFKNRTNQTTALLFVSKGITRHVTFISRWMMSLSWQYFNAWNIYIQLLNLSLLLDWAFSTLDAAEATDNSFQVLQNFPFAKTSAVRLKRSKPSISFGQCTSIAPRTNSNLPPLPQQQLILDQIQASQNFAKYHGTYFLHSLPAVSAGYNDSPLPHWGGIKWDHHYL